MKIRVECDKCGKAFEAEERALTDICPHCMSFVDISKLRNACGRGNPAPAEKKEDKNSDGSGFAGHVCPKENPAPAGRTGKDGDAEIYEALLSRAQTHCERKEWSKAADCYEKCLREGKDWRADFGIVFARTCGFTDFSQFTFAGYDSAKNLTAHVRAAFSGMDEENRKQYAARYLPLLDKRRAELCGERAALDGAVPRACENLRRLGGEDGEEKRETRRSKRKAVVSIWIFSGLLLLSVVGGVIGFFASSYVFAALAVFFAVLFAAGLSVAAVSFQKFRQWEKIDETLRSSYESTIRDKEMLGEVSERASEQIAAIDLISGYLKF